MTIPGSLSSPLLASTTGAAPGAFEISRSLRFNSGDSAFLNRQPSSAGNRKTFTFSTWLKRCATGADHRLFESSADTSNQTTIKTIGDVLQIFDRQSNNIKINLQTSRVFRDLSAWYHIVVSIDTSQSTESNRVKVYINGVQETSFSTATYPAQNQDLYLNQTNQHDIGRFRPSNNQYLDGYLAEINFIDGSALDPTSFGAPDANGVWQATDTAGLSFGTNGFRLKFADNSGSTATTLGKDTSGNSNNWTPNNLSVAAGAGNDSLRDSPNNGTQADTGAGGEVVGNYATWNPLDNGGNTLKDGNLVINGADKNCKSTIAVSSGKWYFEQTGRTSPGIALASTSAAANTDNYQYQYDGNLYHLSGGGYTTTSGGASFGEGDIIGVALDLDNNQLKLYKNGALQSALTKTIAAGTYCFMARSFFNTDHPSNFGQRAFAYALSGYKSLNTASLPTPTIADGSQYFDTKLVSGNSSTQTVSGLNFSPDFVWAKSRSHSTDHYLFDIVRGATNELKSNSASAEGSNSGLTQFNSDGYNMGSDSSMNTSGRTYVNWVWDAGTSTVTNNDGSIASQVRANPSAGFSIVSYTGTGANASVGHGLNDEPHLIFTKNRDASNYGWYTYAKAIGNDKYLVLEDTIAATSFNLWQNTTATSSVFYLSSNAAVMQNNADYIAYCFAPVAGYSAMGQFSGNGSTDGPFIYTGFRPAFVMIKPLYSLDFGGSIVASTSWYMYDSARGTYNANGDILAANKNYAEENNATDIDFLSNGFKLRNTRAVNTSSGSIYYAVAENPFQANGGLAR